MIAYTLDAGLQEAASDKRMHRLLGAGPWQYQLHPVGCMTTWKADGPLSRSAFGAERKTADGMTYFGPKILPTPERLIRAHMVERADLSDVIVSQDTGLKVRIMPAYLSPRMVLDDNTLGDHTTAYGRAVRDLLDKIHANPKQEYKDVAVEMAECCRLAMMYTYRLTRELLTDLGWLNEESIMPIWEGSIAVPKASPAGDGGSLGSP